MKNLADMTPDEQDDLSELIGRTLAPVLPADVLAAVVLMSQQGRGKLIVSPLGAWEAAELLYEAACLVRQDIIESN